MNKLSHSAVQKYGMCPKSYYYHYVERIRSIYQTGALAFGSALDSALNELLLPTGKLTAEEAFIKSFTTQYINGKETYLPTFEYLVYSNNDMDSELLGPEDLVMIKAIADKEGLFSPDDLSHAMQIFGLLKKQKQDSGFDSLNLKQKKFYNLMNWYALRAKGFLMLDAYREKVLPLIEKVRKVQIKVDLNNEDGDAITGFVDLVADIKGHGTVILDNKTSAMEYDADAVVTSPQLSLYVHCLGEEFSTRKGGFIVLKKNVMKNRKKKCSVCGHNGTGSRAKTCDNVINDKRCSGAWDEVISPEVDVQILIDEIPEQTESIVMENFLDVNDAIKQKHFTRNLHSCTNTYGGLCPYFHLCFKGKMIGLVKND